MSQKILISNTKRSWGAFQVMGTLVGSFFVFMGIMLMIKLLGDPHNEVLPVVIVSGFFALMGLGLLAGVAGSIVYLKKKKEQFLAAFASDEATKIFSDRDGAALALWYLVKGFTQHQTLWSKYRKPVYNRYWLEKYRGDLEEFR